ncbi:class I SAM-dependent methyltransferase [Candidatus Saccharibacteria bacterium]|nr:class I SAM-dependent methyltransferase [Candidatus Saccharibacteria bacterium]
MKQVSDQETKIILELAETALGLEGDFVELGCYRGDTSLLLQKLLHKNGYDRRLFLYDSFEGLPERTKEDASVAGDGFSKGELDVTKKEVVLRFKKAGLPVPKIKKAFFEDLDPGVFLPAGSPDPTSPGRILSRPALDPTRPGDLPEKIAFAFLDGDLYGSIKTSLDLVLPRLVKGAVLLVHDYNNPSLPGVARAVDARRLDGSLRETLFVAKW